LAIISLRIAWARAKSLTSAWKLSVRDAPSRDVARSCRHFGFQEIDEGDVEAGLGKRQCTGAADAAGAAGNESRFCHVSSPSSGRPMVAGVADHVGVG